MNKKYGISINGLLFSNKKEPINDIYYIMDQTQKHYAKWKTDNNKLYIVDSIYFKCVKGWTFPVKETRTDYK